MDFVLMHARPVKGNVGVPKFNTLFHLVLYKHDFIGTKSNMELLGDEPLENFGYLDGIFLYVHTPLSIPTGCPTFANRHPNGRIALQNGLKSPPPAGPFCLFCAKSNPTPRYFYSKINESSAFLRSDPACLTHLIHMLEPFDYSIDRFNSRKFARFCIPINFYPNDTYVTNSGIFEGTNGRA
jgi:hypothetical protein